MDRGLVPHPGSAGVLPALPDRGTPRSVWTSAPLSIRTCASSSAPRWEDSSLRVRAAFVAVVLFALLSLFLSTPPALAAQPRSGDAGLSGRVVMGLTDEPLAGAEVTVGPRHAAMTDEAGLFRLEDVPSGTYAVIVRFLGRTSVPVDVRLVPDEVRWVELAVAGPAFQMEELLVQVRRPPTMKMRGFEERMERRAGYFITREDIEESDPLYASSLLDGVGGARVVHDPATGRRSVVVGMGIEACRPELYVDGTPVHEAWLDDFLPHLVEAIEFYPRWYGRPAQFRTPPKVGVGRAFGRDEGCGAIVLWTRDYRG